MPGIDIQNDIVNGSSARFIISDYAIPNVAHEVVSGDGFSLKFKHAEDAANGRKGD
jgi:hypothetical protein